MTGEWGAVKGRRDVMVERGPPPRSYFESPQHERPHTGEGAHEGHPYGRGDWMSRPTASLDARLLGNDGMAGWGWRATLLLCLLPQVGVGSFHHTDAQISIPDYQ